MSKNSKSAPPPKSTLVVPPDLQKTLDDVRNASVKDPNWCYHPISICWKYTDTISKRRHNCRCVFGYGKNAKELKLVCQGAGDYVGVSYQGVRL